MKTLLQLIPGARVLLPILCTLVTGCATLNPVRGDTASGPLRVETDPAAVKRLDAKRKPTDEGPFGGFSVAGDVGRHNLAPTFMLLHNEKVVDEQDFYAIAGDGASVQEVKKYRDLQVALQYVGYYGAQVPAAFQCGLSSFIVLWTAVTLLVFPPFAAFGCCLLGMSTLMTAGYELAGLSLGNVAKGNVQRRDHVLPVDVAQQAAARYNERNGFTPATNRAPALVDRGARVEVVDETDCVDRDALLRDFEALATEAHDSTLRLRVQVTREPGDARRVVLVATSQDARHPRLDRTIDVTGAECRDVPRMIVRVLRAHTSTPPAQAH